MRIMESDETKIRSGWPNSRGALGKGFTLGGTPLTLSNPQMSENPIDIRRTLSVARHVDAVQFSLDTLQPLLNPSIPSSPSEARQSLKSSINHPSSVIPIELPMLHGTGRINSVSTNKADMRRRRLNIDPIVSLMSRTPQY